jgi:hypothetical protein
MGKNRYQINRDGKNSFTVRDIRQVFNDWVGRLQLNRQDLDISEHRNQNQQSNNPEGANSDAVFLGWQKTPSGKEFALYNVIAKNHPLYHSTVSDQTLRKQNLKIPLTPLFQSNEKISGGEK